MKINGENYRQMIGETRTATERSSLDKSRRQYAQNSVQTQIAIKFSH